MEGGRHGESINLIPHWLRGQEVFIYIGLECFIESMVVVIVVGLVVVV